MMRTWPVASNDDDHRRLSLDRSALGAADYYEGLMSAFHEKMYLFNSTISQYHVH